MQHSENLHGCAKIDMENVEKMGMAAQAISDVVKDSLTVPLHRTLSENIDILAEHDVKLTINIARIWSMAAAMMHFLNGEYEKWANAAHLLTDYATVIEEDDEMKATEDFDVLHPKASLVAPSQDDEVNAAEFEEPEPKKRGQEIDKDIEKGYAFDRATLNFGGEYVKQWAHDTMFDTLSGSCEKGHEAMKAWLAHGFKQTDKKCIGPKARAAHDAVTQFAEAYVSITGCVVFTKESHASYVNCFVKGSLHKEFPTIKSLVSAARKPKDFKKLESDVLKCGGEELEFGEDFKQAVQALCPGPGVKAELSLAVVNDVMSRWPNWAKFRAGATAELRFVVVEFVSKYVLDSNGDEIESPAVEMKALKECVKHIDAFEPRCAATAEAYAKTKQTAELKIEALQAKVSVRAFRAVSEDDSSNVYSCSAEFKTIIDTVNDTDFLDEGMALVVEWVCDNFIKQLVSFCDVFLESKGEGEGEDKIKNLVANLKYFSARLKALGKDPKYPVDVVEPMMVKSLAVYWTHHKFAENASKPHWTAFNKAVQNFKSKKYTVSGQMKDLLRASLKLCHVGYLSHAEESKKRVSISQRILKMSSLTSRRFAGAREMADAGWTTFLKMPHWKSCSKRPLPLEDF